MNAVEEEALRFQAANGGSVVNADPATPTGVEPLEDALPGRSHAIITGDASGVQMTQGPNPVMQEALHYKFNAAIDSGEDVSGIMQQMSQAGMMPAQSIDRPRAPDIGVLLNGNPAEDHRRAKLTTWINAHTVSNIIQPGADEATISAVMRRELHAVPPEEWMPTDPAERARVEEQLHNRMFNAPMPALPVMEEAQNFAKRALMSQGNAIGGLTSVAGNVLGSQTLQNAGQQMTDITQLEMSKAPSSPGFVGDVAQIGSQVAGDTALMMGSAGIGEALGFTGKAANVINRIAMSAIAGAQGGGNGYNEAYQRLRQIGLPDDQARHGADLAAAGRAGVSAATAQLFGGNPQPAAQAGLAGVGRAALAGGAAAAIGTPADIFLQSRVTGDQADYSKVLPAVLTSAGVAGGLHAFFGLFNNAKTAKAQQTVAEEAARRSDPNGMTESQARETLGLGRGDVDPETIKAAFKSAVLKAHPDAGGTAADFQNVIKAKAAMDAVYGRPASPSTSSPVTTPPPAEPATTPRPGVRENPNIPAEAPPARPAEPVSTAEAVATDFHGATEHDQALLDKLAEVSREAPADEKKPAQQAAPDLTGATFEGSNGGIDPEMHRRLSTLLADDAPNPAELAKAQESDTPKGDVGFTSASSARTFALNRAEGLGSPVFVYASQDGKFYVDRRLPAQEGFRVLPGGGYQLVKGPAVEGTRAEGERRVKKAGDIITKPAEAPAASPVTDLVNRYEDVGDLTITDLVNRVESLDTGEPHIEQAIEDYRTAQAEDHELAGRGDMDAAEEQFLKAIKRAKSAEIIPGQAPVESKVTGSPPVKQPPKSVTVQRIGGGEHDFLSPTEHDQGLLDQLAGVSREAPKAPIQKADQAAPAFESATFEAAGGEVDAETHKRLSALLAEDAPKPAELAKAQESTHPIGDVGFSSATSARQFAVNRAEGMGKPVFVYAGPDDKFYVDRRQPDRVGFRVLPGGGYQLVHPPEVNPPAEGERRGMAAHAPASFDGPRNVAAWAAQFDPDVKDSSEFSGPIKDQFREELSKLQGGTDKYVLADVPLELPQLNDNYQPATAKEYQGLDAAHRPPGIGGFDPSGDFVFVDGNTRARAAKANGETSIRAYVPESAIGKAGIAAAGKTSSANVEPAILEKNVQQDAHGNGEVLSSGGGQPGESAIGGMGQTGDRALEGAPTGPGNKSQPPQQLEERGNRGAGEGQEPIRTGRGGGSGPGIGAGEGAGGSHPPAEQGGEPAVAPGQERGPAGSGGAIRPVSESAGPKETGLVENYRFTGTTPPAPKGLKARFKANVDAIRALRRIEGSGQPPTPADQAIIARFGGWGALPQAFSGVEGWADEAQELRDVLTPAEYEAAKRSTLNAHYTDPQTIADTWDMIQRLGFTGGRVLEPSLGMGHFFAMQPPALAGNSMLTGVELDPITGGLARILFPHANIQVKGYQQLRVPDNFFDLIVSNFPFGDYRVQDKRYNAIGAPIHDYFFLKSADLVRPGGLVVGITSTGTLDKASPRVRAELAKQMDLVAAIRLPAGTHAGAAGTEVVTDLLILKKRAPGEKAGGADWMALGEVHDPDGGKMIPINEYFVKHPENVLGTVDRKSKLYGAGHPHVSAFDAAKTRELMQAAIDALPRDVMTPAAEKSPAFEQIKPKAIGGKEGSLTVKDGHVMRREGDGLVKVDVEKKTAELIGAQANLRDVMRNVYAVELGGGTDAQLATARRKLNEAYDAFVKKHGPLHKLSNARAFADDPDAPVLLALEDNYDPKKGTATKAAIFTRATIRAYEKPTHASSPGDALGISLNETGGVSLDRVAQLLGVTEAEAGQSLVKEGIAYESPSGGWQSAERYLSGNVRQKLVEAQEAALADKRYRPNVAALEKVQPADVDYDQIDVRLGVPWIGPDDVQHFAAETIGGIPEHFSIRYLANSGEWLADYTGSGVSRHKGRAQDVQLYGTARAPFTDVLEAALNNRIITIYDKVDDTRVMNAEESASANAKAQELNALFKHWVWDEDARRVRLHRRYNDTFNAVRPVEFDGSHLRFPGMNPGVVLRPHQVNAAWRVISTGTALLGHEVGTGKTYSMVAAALELKRLGLASKPAIAVLKSTLEGFASQARGLYPNARILVVDRFEAKNRKAAIAKISTGNYDLIIFTHDQLDMLPMHTDVQKEFIQREIDELEAVLRDVKEQGGGKNGGETRMVKKLERSKLRLEQRLEEALAGKQDNAITFEETGIDHLFVDEAHKYKSLPVYTKQERVKGIPQGRSDRATMMWMRSQWLQSMNGGRGVVFATGTPVTNTMAELYTMQRYLQYRDLVDRGIAAFDAWARTFGDITSRMEYTVTGDYKPVARFNKFVNLPELQQLARNMLDVQRAKNMPGFTRPRKEEKAIAVPMSPAQQQYLQLIKKRAQEVKTKRPGEGGDNMLSISMDARKSAIDMRMVDPTAADDPDSKLNTMVRAVLDFYRSNPGKTQMIFSDIGIGKTKWGFSPFEDIVQKLIDGGVPPEKIINFGDLTDAEKRTAATRLDTADAVIALGSTDKLGTGVNAQTYLIALHHMDVPWLPGSLEQRDGRGWRQGNTNASIAINRYVTQGSFDTFMWQAVDAKTRFIQQVTDGESIARTATDDDSEELTPAQVMAIASGNPLMLDKIQNDADLSELTAAEKRHRTQELRLRDALNAIGRQVENERAYQDRLNADLALVKKANPDFEMKIGKETFYKRDEANTALLQAAESSAGTSSANPKTLGSYKGMSIITWRGFTGLAMALRGANTYTAGQPTVASLDYYAREAYLEDELAKSSNKVKTLIADQSKAEKQLGRPFPRAEELVRAKARAAELQEKLEVQANGPKAAPAPEAQSQDVNDILTSDEDEEGDDSEGDGERAASQTLGFTPPASKGVSAATGDTAAPNRPNLYPLALPELVRMAKLLTGDVPTFKRFRKAAGMFYATGRGRIKMHPKLMPDPYELAVTLGHEIGHLADWLPNLTLKRGNLIGRLHTLRSFTSQTFGPSSVTNKEVKRELIDLSAWWSPWNRATAKKSEIAYRDSARELYAEAVSVLLNAPAELEARAPKFYKELLANLNRKPEVLKTFLDLQDLMNGTTEELIAARRADLREAYTRAEEVWKNRATEKASAKLDILTAIQQLLIDRAAPLSNRVAKLEREGKVIPENLNAKYAAHELGLMDNVNHLMLRQIQDEVINPLLGNEADLDDLGEYLQMKRITGDVGAIDPATGQPARLGGDRNELANPQGHTPETAQQELDDLRRVLGNRGWAAVEAAAEKFHAIVFKAVETARDLGTYNSTTFLELEKNKNHYATFAVVDYLQDHIPAAVMQQVGTFKDVANPFVATVMKTVTLNRLNELQRAKIATRDMLLGYFPADIEKAKTPIKGMRGGKPIFGEPKRPPQGKEHLVLLENGRPAYYVVDRYVAKVFQNHDVGLLGVLSRAINTITYKPFHALYVVLNPAWALANVPRDFQRLYKGLGGHASIGQILAKYAGSIAQAKRYAWGIDDPLIKQMLEDKALAARFEDFDPNADVTQLERLMARYGAGDVEKGRSKLMDSLHTLLDGIENLGAMSVAVPKVAAYKLLGNRGIDGKRRAYLVRNLAGHPDRRQRGLATTLSNGVFMYSNVMIQAARADYEAATAPSTRSGFWLRTMLLNLLPKMLMRLAAAGLFGGSMALMMKLIGEYDKTNYTCIPYGFTKGKDGELKTLYFRIPHDETGRLASGLLWKLTEKPGTAKQMQQVLDFNYSQLPHVSPALDSIWKWSQFSRGINPYDEWRREGVVRDDAFKAGGWYAFKDMAQWQLNQFGVVSMLLHPVIGYGKGGSESETTVQTAVQSVPGINRFFKASDQGAREEEAEQQAVKDAEDARFRLGLPDNVRHLVGERFRLHLVSLDQLDAEKQDRRARLDNFYNQYLRLTHIMKIARDDKDQKGFDQAKDDLEAASKEIK